MSKSDPVADANARLDVAKAKEARRVQFIQTEREQVNAIDTVLMPKATEAFGQAVADGDFAAMTATQTEINRLVAAKRDALARIEAAEQQAERNAWDLRVAESSLKRVVARAALPPAASAEVSEDCLTEGFSHLGEVLANGIALAITAIDQDARRGVTEALGAEQLARWVWVQCAQAGLDLHLARHVQSGTGIGPAETLANVRAILETI